MSRRELILGAAGRLFQRGGFRKTTMAEIAHVAGIGKGSIYLESAGKEDVFPALVGEHELGIPQEVRQVASASGPVDGRLTAVALIRPRRNLREMEETLRALAHLLIHGMTAAGGQAV
jgi:AcrR family transcriptional regulator